MKKEISISPFYIVLFLYFLMNSFYVLRGYGGDLWIIESFPTIIAFSYIQKAYWLFIVSIFLIIISYWLISRIINKKKIFFFSNKAGWLLLIIQIAYILYSSYFNINIAGHLKDESSANIIDKFFNRLQPDLIFIAIAPALHNKKLFYTNVVIYLLSNILRGWMGGLFIVIVVILCRNKGIKFTLKKAITYSLIALFFVGILPFASEAKWIIRDQEPIVNIFKNVLTTDYFSHVLSTLDYISNRLQHIGNIALVIKEQEIFYEAYLNGEILPYWQDGMSINIIKKLLGITQSEGTSIGSFAFNTLFFEPIGYTRNIHVGIASWLVILYDKFYYFVLFSLFVILIPGVFLVKYADIKLISILITASLIFLLHGWIATYMDLVTYIIVFVTFQKIKIRYPHN